MFLKKVIRSKRTFAFRLTLWYAGIFLFSSVLVFVISYFMIASALEKRTDLELLIELKEFASLYELKGISEVKESMVIEAESEGMENMFLRLVERSGVELVVPELSKWGNGDLGRESVKQVKDRKGHVFETLHLPSQEHSVRVLTSSFGGGEILQIGKSTENDEHLLKTCRDIFSVTAVSMLAFAALVGFFMAKGALRGVVELTRTADQISKGDLDLRVTEAGQGEEIDNLARTFNRMLGRIQALVKRMGEMTDNIAHDLRSPITRIRGIAETTLMSSESTADYEIMAGSVVEECDRMLGMINTMLDISEAEAGVAQLATVDIDVAGVVRDACEIFRPVAENNNVQIVQQLTPNSSIRGDKLKIQRAISNILDNALKYTPAGGTVTVSVNWDESNVVTSIQDTGTGISPADLPRIFDRFFRGDQSRPHPGTGLGLTLARALARAHGGDMEVKSSPNEGTIVTMVLPRSFP
jgi:heavy metal sensor kinase